MEGRITTVYERVLTTLVDNIEHIESTTVNGTAVVKIFLQPSASLDTANAQVTAASQTILRQLPAGTQPPLIINFSASSVPILQLALSGDGLTESQLNDIALNFLRTQLVTVPGAAVPYPYGGKQRQVMVSLNPQLLQAKGLSPSDVVSAVNLQNLVLPSGTAKIDQFEYDVDLNAAPRTVAELNDLPVKVANGATIYLRDVAQVSDGFAPQTNIVRQDGKRSALVTVLKAGNASTIDVVDGVRKLLPRTQLTLPPELKIQPLGDQSIFVRAAVSGVIREAIIAACLTGLMILIFLGSWRSTLIIAVSIPAIDSLFGDRAGTSARDHQCDDARRTGPGGGHPGGRRDRHHRKHRALSRARLPICARRSSKARARLRFRRLVSTLCICIVFLPMFFLSGRGALSVRSAGGGGGVRDDRVLCSFAHAGADAGDIFAKSETWQFGDRAIRWSGFSAAFERGFERLRLGYQLLLTTLVYRRFIFVPAFLVCARPRFCWCRGSARIFFRTRIAANSFCICARKRERALKKPRGCAIWWKIPFAARFRTGRCGAFSTTSGFPLSQLNFMRSTTGLIGNADADIFVSLDERHHPTAGYIRDLRKSLPAEFPGVTFYFLPADIVTQILNFGLPAPVDIQIDGADVEANRAVADHMLEQIRHVPGIADARLQQDFDYPKFHIAIDRTKAVEGGYTPRDVASSVLVSLSGSFQVTPAFFLNWQNGVSYNLVEQTPQYSIQSLQDLQNIPITAPAATHPEILADVASIKRSNEMAVLSHYNIRRVLDIYATVQDRDLGGAGREITRIVDANRGSLPRGSFVTVRGQLDTMRTSYIGLLAGLGFAIVLVYLLIVVNFQSWLDPFVIITALPAALAGIVVFLFLTHTTLSVPALMGSIMCMGVATANSILVVAFAKDRLAHHGDAVEAAIEAGYTRFRPVLMTALAMIIGMIPMALGLGEGGEQNAPLGRAVIGGLLCATLATLVFVPAVFAIVHRSRARQDSADIQEAHSPMDWSKP